MPMKSAIILTFILVSTALTGFTQETKKESSLREKIKQRWLKKQHEKPAPEAEENPVAKIEKPGTHTFKIKHDGLDRYYVVFVPSAYTAKNPLPLLVAMHGGGGDMNLQASPEYYKLTPKAEKEGFIIAYPNGYSKLKSGKLATWNAGTCCGDARDKKIDDVGFIKKMISNLSTQLKIDQKRIFATGMSNGGLMAYRLACELPQLFKAVAAVAGTDNTLECKPEQPVSVLHIHAKNDDHVLFNGGAGKEAFGDRTKITEFTSVPATMAKWVKLNACEASPKRNLEEKQAYCETYSKCSNGTEVQLCVTETGGHSWPGGKKIRRGKESPSTAISANDVMWNFFKNRN